MPNPLLIAELFFWTSVAIIVYVYVGYPLLLAVVSVFVPRTTTPQPHAWPSVTLLIAAYNEQDVIADKIHNSLELDYPRDKLDIVVASDGSTDRTDQIVARFALDGVRLERIEGRRGKTAAQNHVVQRSDSDVVIFSDANAMYDRDVVKLLVKHLLRDDVGCVEGRRLDYSPEASGTAAQELKFRDYESWLKVLESRVLSCTGATGPIYAVRRSLYVPLDDTMISDLMEPMMIMYRHRKRHVYEPGAVSRETALANMRDELHRKVRIINRALFSITSVPGIMNPLETGWFAWQVISHKFLRYFIPVFMIAALIACIPLWARMIYGFLLIGQLAFYACALVGWALDKVNAGPSFLRTPYYFCSANAASLIAIRRWLTGRNIVTWSTQRRSPARN